MKRRFIAAVMSLLMTVSLVLPSRAGEMEIRVSEVEAEKPPLGEELTDFMPLKDPFYGLLRVCYEDITDETDSQDGTIAMKKGYFPVLLKNGHVLVDVSMLCAELGINVTVDDNGWTLQSHERRMKIFENTDTFFYTLGEGNSAVSFLQSNLSCKTSRIDETLWAPFNDLSIMMGLNGQIYTIDGETYYTLYTHREDALDVLAELKRDSSKYSFDYVNQIPLTDEQMQTLYTSSGISTFFDELLNFDLDTWKALIVSSIPLTGDAGMAIWEESMCCDLVQALVGQGVDEAWVSSADNAENMGDIANLAYFAASGAEQMQKASLEDIYGEMSKLLTNSESMNEALFGAFFQKTARGIKNCADNARFLNGVGDAVGEGLFYVTQAFSLGSIAVNYLNREQVAVDTLKTVLDQLPDNAHLPDNCVESMQENLAEYEKNMAQYSFGTYIRQNGGDLVSFGAGVVSKAFALGTVPLAFYNLGSTFIPEVNESLKSMKDFQLSLYARDLQYDVQNYMRKQIPGSEKETISEEQLEKALNSAYLYLKTCYVARSLGLSALSKEELSFPTQRSINQNVLRKIAISINARGGDEKEIPLILPSECVSTVENSNDQPLYDMAIPLYMHLNGSVLNRADDTPVEDAKGRAYDQDGRELGYFFGKTDGTYEVYVPLVEEDILPVNTELETHFQVKLSFTSDTVSGEGEVNTDFESKAERKMDDCYLETLVKNNGGTVVGYGWDVYYWRFSKDNMSEYGMFGHFQQKTDGVCELVCRGRDGLEMVVTTGTVSLRNLYIMKGRIYWNSVYNQVSSVNLDGSDLQMMEAGSICGIDEKNHCLLTMSDGVLQAYFPLDGKRIPLANDWPNFLMAREGVVYYTTNPNETTLTVMWAKEDGTEFQALAQVPLEGDYTMTYCEGQMVQVVGDSLYLSYGCYAGTGLFFQPGGGIVRIALDGSGYEKIVTEKEEITAPYFLATEEEGTPFLYYSTGEGCESLAGMWDYLGYMTPCKKRNLVTNEVMDSDFVLSEPGDKIYQDGQVQALLGDSADYTTLISTAGFANLGYPKIGELDNNDYIVVRDVEVVGDMVYFTVDYAARDSQGDMGWRPNYVRNYSKLYQVPLGSDECQLIYEY